MNLSHRGASGAALLFALAAAPAAQAQTFYPGDATITTAITGDVVIGSSQGYMSSSAANVVLSDIGSIGHDVAVANGSSFTMNGNVGGSLSAYDTSTINVNGGTLSYALFADNDSVVNITGGTLLNVVNAFNNGTVNVSGGDFGSIVAFGNSTINLYGDVTATLKNSAYGYQGAYSQYTLGGALANNAVTNGAYLYVVNNSGATFSLKSPAVFSSSGIGTVPEPGSVALLVGLGVTGAGFARRRRNRA